MTFVSRSLRPSKVVTDASGLLNEGRASEAIGLLSFALQAEPEDPDLYWLRGCVHWRLAFRDDDPERYGWALRDFAEAAALDPSMFVKLKSIWPRHEWALPAYRQRTGLPSRCR